MARNVTVSTISRDPNFEKEIKIETNTIRTGKEAKKAISQGIGLPIDRFDVLRLSECVLLDDTHVITRHDWESGVCLIVHPADRQTVDYLQTKQEDMINGDMEDDTRVIMSCYHAITADTLFDYCLNMLKQGNTVFECPAINDATIKWGKIGEQCKCQWTLYEVNLKACLSTDERVLFEMMMSNNKLKEDQTVGQCPFCSAVSTRAVASNNRVRCQVCTKKTPNRCEFCWQCLHEWKTSDTEYCGNLECTTSKGPKAIQNILDTAAKKTIDRYKDVPSVRSCIHCKALVEHISGCKRMICKSCKKQFCFVCLKKWEKGGCGYNTTCSQVANTQRHQ